MPIPDNTNVFPDDLGFSTALTDALSLVDPASLFGVLLQQSDLAISLWDLEGTLMYATWAKAALFRAPAAALLGKSAAALFPSDSSLIRAELFKQAAGEPKAVVSYEVIGNLPTVMVLSRLVCGAGTARAIMCVAHVGPSATTFRHDPQRMVVAQRSQDHTDRLATLTKRERDVLVMLVEGKSHKKIAEIIHRSLKTVEWHRAQLGRKLGVATRAELIHIATRHELLDAAGSYDCELAESGVATGDQPIKTHAD